MWRERASELGEKGEWRVRIDKESERERERVRAGLLNFVPHGWICGIAARREEGSIVGRGGY